MPNVNDIISYQANVNPIGTTSPVYAWSLPDGGGTITTNNGDDIVVTWGAVAGNYKVRVQVTSGDINCPYTMVFDEEIVELTTTTTTTSTTTNNNCVDPSITITSNSGSLTAANVGDTVIYTAIVSGVADPTNCTANDILWSLQFNPPQFWTLIGGSITSNTITIRYDSPSPLGVGLQIKATTRGCTCNQIDSPTANIIVS